MLNQTVMGCGSDNTWVVEERISHGWGTTAEGKVDVFLSWHEKFEHHGVLSLCMGKKPDVLKPPVKEWCFGLPKPYEFF